MLSAAFGTVVSVGGSLCQLCSSDQVHDGAFPTSTLASHENIEHDESTYIKLLALVVVYYAEDIYQYLGYPHFRCGKFALNGRTE